VVGVAHNSSNLWQAIDSVCTRLVLCLSLYFAARASRPPVGSPAPLCVVVDDRLDVWEEDSRKAVLQVSSHPYSREVVCQHLPARLSLQNRLCHLILAADWPVQLGWAAASA
jgi:hypothetical protein